MRRLVNRYSSPSPESAPLLLSGAGSLFDLVVFNPGAAAKVVQIYDAAALSEGVSSPVCILGTVPAGGYASVSFVNGLPFNAGIIVNLNAACGAYSATGAGTAMVCATVAK